MADSVIQEGFEEWVSGDTNFTAGAQFVSCKDGVLTVNIGEEKTYKFELHFPAEYPKTKARFNVKATSGDLKEWAQQVNEFCNGPSSSVPAFTIDDVLSECANSFAELVEGQGDDDGYDDVGVSEPIDVPKKPQPKGPKPGEFYVPPQGSGSATARLLSDLERVKEADWGRQFGFYAELFKDPTSGLPDLYHWNVKLMNFEKDDSLYSELKQRKLDGIVLDLSFPFDYPNNPPFVRVVRPRFAFRTGHVTVGGSICMELLTNSGWMPTNDIESIIIQIRVNMNSGGAKLDQGNHSDYGESEAFDAFDRVAGDHSWGVPDWRKYRRSY